MKFPSELHKDDIPRAAGADELLAIGFSGSPQQHESVMPLAGTELVLMIICVMS